MMVSGFITKRILYILILFIFLTTCHPQRKMTRSDASPFYPSSILNGSMFLLRLVCGLAFFTSYADRFVQGLCLRLDRVTAGDSDTIPCIDDDSKPFNGRYFFFGKICCSLLVDCIWELTVRNQCNCLYKF